MKTFDLTHDTLSGFPKRLLAFHHKLEQRNPLHFNLHLHVDQSSLKSVKKYMAGVISESIKQNLLGADINMELLILMLRGYAQTFMGSVAQTVNTLKISKPRVTNRHELVS